MTQRTRSRIGAAMFGGMTTMLVAMTCGTEVSAQIPGALPFAINAATCPRVADPKLADGRIPITVELRPAFGAATVTLTLLQSGTPLGQIWSGVVDCSATFVHVWDGKLVIAPSTVPQWVDTGSYDVRVDAVRAGSGQSVSHTLPLQVVRLGITEIAALPNGADTEWQMVYFKRGTASGTFFWATPAIHEYLNIAGAGEVSDLDRNDASPRPTPPVHLATASPLMETTTVYEDDAYNYPLCYVENVEPRFEVRFGAFGTNAAGAAMPANYPVAGVSIRCRADSSLGPWTSVHSNIAPNGTQVFTGPRLPYGFRCHDFTITWRFESSIDGGTTWSRVPGAAATPHRLYTIFGRPRFGGTAGTQYAGPWVEVADYARVWSAAIGVGTDVPARLTEVIMKGFGGQIGSLPAAIESVRYDAPSLGGDGGASHYYSGSHSVQLSRLLDNHTNGIFVNCSDCASASSSMLGMLGLTNVQMNRLGSMTLRAIRGIGAPAYTLDLWGGGGHAFSYHHVVTRTAGQSICDPCLWVDEDGAPMQLPGTPGYNHDRPWAGTSKSYMSLLATGPITFQLEALPTLQ